VRGGVDLDGANLLTGEPAARGSAPAELRTVQASLDRRFMGEGSATLATVELFAVLGLGPSATEQSPMSLARQIGATLDRIGIAFEPDRRYGHHGLSAQGVVVLFRFPNGAPVDPERAEYAEARKEVEAAIAAGVAEIDPAFPQFEPIGVSAEGLAKLATDERLRLHAYGVAMFETARRMNRGT